MKFTKELRAELDKKGIKYATYPGPGVGTEPTDLPGVPDTEFPATPNPPENQSAAKLDPALLSRFPYPKKD